MLFLRTYVPSRQASGDIAEDSLDCPLVELGLIIATPQTYHFRRGKQEPILTQKDKHDTWTEGKKGALDFAGR